MEMFDRDVQPVMNEYLKGYIREKNFTKDARTWGNYRDYKPMVEFAKEKKLDVGQANGAYFFNSLGVDLLSWIDLRCGKPVQRRLDHQSGRCW